MSMIEAQVTRYDTAGSRKRDLEASLAFQAVCFFAAGSATAIPAACAEAEEAQSPLPPVTIDAPAAKKKPITTASPSSAHKLAKAALRKRTKELQNQQAAPSAGTSSPLPVFAQQPGANPYADPAAPYKADRLSSRKFTEPLLNTPRTVTVLTKEVLEDKNATTLREIGRTTAGVTLGSGEGGNAFGDRFFIRGFDARNDVFVDGVRDPGVSIRENFFTEQVEILRGPASSFAGRGTTGGAINIVTKKASDQDFNIIETTLASDQTKRVTIDVNKAISPILDVRVNGLFQDAGVAGRDFTTDDRNGIAAALTFKPLPDLTFQADYAHSYLSGLPDFGVPYDLSIQRPVTEGVVPRNTYYGIINRDFTKTTQNIGTLDAEYKVNDWLTFNNKARQGYSILNYIGTIPENPSGAAAASASTAASFLGLTQLNAQSRFETSAVLADEPELTAKFDTGPVKHTVVFGAEFDRERISINTYAGLTSELATSATPFTSTGSVVTSIYDPLNYEAGYAGAYLGNNPQIYHVDTKAVYLMDTANWNDRLIFNWGVRFDDYGITSQNNTSAVSANDGIVSYNLGLVYKPIPITSLYAAYATAADPVGDELDAVTSSYGGLSPTQNMSQIFGPIRSEAIELGNKWELFDRHLLVTGALFQTNVENARESTPAGLPNPAGGVYPTSTVVAGAAYRVQGIDVEMAGKISGKWSVLGGAVFMKSDITQSVVPHDVGLQLANIAHQSFNLLSKYQITPWFELGGQAVWRSQVLGGSLLAANGGVSYNATPVPTILPSFWRFDAFAETSIGPYTTLKLYVANIFNRTYYDSIYQSNTPFIRVAPGRTVSLIATAKF